MKTSVTLTYFNRSGVAFAYEYFETTTSAMESLIFDVGCMRDDGKLPNVAGHEEFSYILLSADAQWAYPHLILPPFLKNAVRAHWAATNRDAAVTTCTRSVTPTS